MNVTDDGVITIPNRWEPRWYQEPAWNAWMSGAADRLFLGWHRRAGKDDIALNGAAVKMVTEPGTYWHMLPEAAQARKAIWDAVDPHTGRKRIDQAFPQELRTSTRNNDMFLSMAVTDETGKQVGESTWQVVGSDNFNSLVGSPPKGVVFSEWALADPTAWHILRPILAENGGWALFITTPRGKNHAYKTYETALAEGPENGWFGEMLPVSKTRALSFEVLAREQREYIAFLGENDGKAMYKQEYEVDWNAPVIGSYYGEWLRKAEEEGRVTQVPYDPRYPVYTFWDLGVDDHTSCWFIQPGPLGQTFRVIDYLEGSGQGVDYYAGELRQRPYNYAPLRLPHDAEARKMGITVSTVAQDFRTLGFQVTIAKALGPGQKIPAVRRALPRCLFDATKTSRGRDCLSGYQKKWDELNKTFLNTPLHNWASHGADAFGEFALDIDSVVESGRAGTSDWTQPIKTRHGGM